MHIKQYYNCLYLLHILVRDRQEFLKFFFSRFFCSTPLLIGSTCVFYSSGCVVSLVHKLFHHIQISLAVCELAYFLRCFHSSVDCTHLPTSESSQNDWNNESHSSWGICQCRRACLNILTGLPHRSFPTNPALLANRDRTVLIMPPRNAFNTLSAIFPSRY